MRMRYIKYHEMALLDTFFLINEITTLVHCFSILTSENILKLNCLIVIIYYLDRSRFYQ